MRFAQTVSFAVVLLLLGGAPAKKSFSTCARSSLLITNGARGSE